MWAVYGLFAVFLVVNLWFPLLSVRKLFETLKGLDKDRRRINVRIDYSLRL